MIGKNQNGYFYSCFVNGNRKSGWILHSPGDDMKAAIDKVNEKYPGCYLQIISQMSLDEVFNQVRIEK